MVRPDEITLSRAIDRYVGSVEGAGYSPHTLKSYSTRLNDFLRWVVQDAGDQHLWRWRTAR